MESHDLVYAKDRRRSKVKTHREVESVLHIHFWKPAITSPVNGWMDYCYQPPDSREEIQPVASLPTPFLVPNPDAFDATPDSCLPPPPSALPDDWKLAFFPATLECVQRFAARVNDVTGEEVFVVQEKPFYWMRALTKDEEGEEDQQEERKLPL